MLKEIRDDFDPGRIAQSGQCFRWTRTEDGAYRFMSRGSCVYIAERGAGLFEFDCGEAEFDSLWRNYFDLNENYAAIRARIDPVADPFLYAAAEYEKGIRILRQDPWETLISFIISQNRNIPAIRRSVELLAERCGDARTDGRGIPFRAFPAPEALAALGEADLKACGLGYRWSYVRAAASAVVSGDLDPYALCRAENSEARDALMRLYGVGGKVADCVCLFGLRCKDAFPRDVWINRVLALHYPDGYPYERYSPYNGVFQQYMFAYIRDCASGAV